MKNLFTVIILLTMLRLEAQNLRTPTLSPLTEIKQEVGLTEITLSYSRPSANGRTVFGELVPFGEIWRTGANASTKLTFTEEVKIAGNPLPAGTYALYTIPGQQEWTVIIHKKTDMRSIAAGSVKPENDAFRFKVRPMAIGEKVGTFTIQFADITTKSCHLQLSWENTMVRFPIECNVDAKVEAQIAELTKDPEKTTHQAYFLAAEYYLYNDKDLDQAMKWIDAALGKSPENYRYGLLKSKIYGGQGKTDMAASMVKTAHEWANAANNANYKQQTLDYLAVLEKGNAKTSAPTNPYANDVTGLDNILMALYSSISGEKGEKRDWDSCRHFCCKYHYNSLPIYFHNCFL